MPRGRGCGPREPWLRGTVRGPESVAEANLLATHYAFHGRIGTLVGSPRNGLHAVPGTLGQATYRFADAQQPILVTAGVDALSRARVSQGRCRPTMRGRFSTVAPSAIRRLHFF